MPTLDDAPTLETMTHPGFTGTDLIQIYDSREQKAKTVSLSQLLLYIDDQLLGD